MTSADDLAIRRGDVAATHGRKGKRFYNASDRLGYGGGIRQGRPDAIGKRHAPQCTTVKPSDIGR